MKKINDILFFCLPIILGCAKEKTAANAKTHNGTDILVGMLIMLGIVLIIVVAYFWDKKFPAAKQKVISLLKISNINSPNDVTMEVVDNEATIDIEFVAENNPTIPTKNQLPPSNDNDFASKESAPRAATQYAHTIVPNGFRNDLKNEQGDAFFRLTNISDTADFEFCGKDFERAKAKKSSLEIVCNIEGLYTQATQIQSEAKGKVKLISDQNRWEVIHKATVKFI
jgi:hypothetical protein